MGIKVNAIEFYPILFCILLGKLSKSNANIITRCYLIKK